MPRFFIPCEESFAGSIRITGRDAEHIKVLRLRIGEELTVCDGRGTDYHCRLIRSDGYEAEAEIVSVSPCPAEASVFTTVYCGLLKGDKTDYIIQKSVEAGASAIVFFDSERVIQRTDGVCKKLDRWNRIAEEAAKQCGRGMIPAVRWLESFDAMLNEAAKAEASFFLYETGERKALSAALIGSDTLRSASVITGPEGGFEPCEAEKAKSLGMHVCSMGARILRCETAPVVALTALMLTSGNLE